MNPHRHASSSPRRDATHCSRSSLSRRPTHRAGDHPPRPPLVARTAGGRSRLIAACCWGLQLNIRCTSSLPSSPGFRLPIMPPLPSVHHADGPRHFPHTFSSNTRRHADACLVAVATPDAADLAGVAWRGNEEVTLHTSTALYTCLHPVPLFPQLPSLHSSSRSSSSRP